MTDINTWAGLHNIRNNLSDNYTLTADLPSSGVDYNTYASSSANGGLGWLPIGDNYNQFTGSFNGNGKIIPSLHINRPDTSYCGLFGYCREATIKNVKVIDAEYNVGQYSGGIIGYNYNGDGTDFVSGCSFTGTIDTNGDYIGGLVGYNYVDFTDTSPVMNNSYAHVSITRSGNYATSIGGLIGANLIYGNSFSITNCYVEGYYTQGYNPDKIIKGYSYSSYIGGLIGQNRIDYNWNSSIIINFTMTGCDVTGDIEFDSISGYLGGLIGDNRNFNDIDTNTFYVHIEDCNFNGNINILALTDANSYIGGLIGYNEIYNNKPGDAYINNCYSTGSLSGYLAGRVGGLIGENVIVIGTGNIFFDKCYSSMNVSSIDSKEYIGTFIGKNQCAINTVESNPYITTCFKICKNNNESVKAYLHCSTSYAISYIGGLIGDNYLTGIDFSVYNFSADVSISSSASGTRIGGLIGENIMSCGNNPCDCIIYNCDVNCTIEVVDNYSNYIGGLIGYHETADVNFYLTNSFVKAYNPYASNNIIDIGSSCNGVGGLIGYIGLKGNGIINNATFNYTISDCYVEGDINSLSIYQLGGVIGYCYVLLSNDTNINNTYIENCYFNGDILVSTNSTANTEIGGFIGENYISIAEGYFYMNNCYSAGSLSSDGWSLIGGFIGENYITLTTGNIFIDKCYSSMNVSLSNLASVAGGFIGTNTCNITTIKSDPYITTKFQIRKNNNENTKAYFTISSGVSGYTTNNTGGLIGENNLTNIDFFTYNYSVDSSITTSISGNAAGVSGFIGYNNSNNSNISLNNCSSDFDINTSDMYYKIGGILGGTDCSNSDISINNCHSHSTIITGDNCYAIGGLIGSIYITGGSLSLTDSYSRAYNPYISNNIIESGSFSIQIGCLIGYIFIATTFSDGETNNFTISNCNSEGDITVVRSNSPVSGIGGLIGYIEIRNESNSNSPCNVDIDNCYAKTNISMLQLDSRNIRIGGFIGYNYYNNSYTGAFNIDKCFSIGSISNAHDAGGFIGYSVVNSNSGTKLIQDCFSIVDVSTSNISAGFIGDQQSAYPHYKNCYASGVISSTQAGMAAGFVSQLNGYTTSFTDCFWDTDRSGAYGIAPDGSATGLNGRTTANMKIQSTFTNWNFTNMWSMSNVSSEFLGYPYFYVVPSCRTYIFYLSTIGKVLYISNAGELSATICD